MNQFKARQTYIDIQEMFSTQTLSDSFKVRVEHERKCVNYMTA